MANQSNSFFVFLAAVLLLLSCKQEAEKKTETDLPEAPEQFAVEGSYVSDGYDDRADRSDWVAVEVTKTENGHLNISVRSRADLKKPTCTFDGEAYRVDETTFETLIDGKSILIQFSDMGLSISAKNKTEEGILYFYCSGGASLAGTYKKINGELDKVQLDKTQFSKVLNLQDVGFNVSSIPKDKSNQLTVFTFGLPNEYRESFDIGTNLITQAEVEDLNADGSPELVVFAENQSEPKKMTVYAFSVNNKKSMSQVFFQPIEDNKEINEGYNGNDEFALVENYLVQRFPIYENGNKTNKLRQIQYQLVDGEASRRFEVVKQSEFDLK
ncbi:hypothetical protein JYB64_03195 [Algoriphagus aestuarii]|nr:hypothetical protein [Algoriphagus aestuarii]